MASLRRHPNSSYFIACFSANDRRYQRSTKIKADGSVAARRKAQKIANEFEDLARGKTAARQVHRVFKDLYAELTGTSLPDQSIRHHSTNWLQDKSGTVAPHTHEFYKSRILSFSDFLGRKADAPLGEIQDSDVREWRDLEAQRVSASTANHGLKVLRMFFEDAKRRNIIADNPASLVPVLKRSHLRTRRPFTMEEIRRLLKELDDEWQSLVMFALYTGQRLGDLARLTWNSIELDAMEIRIETSKTGRQQKIPICAPLLRHIQKLKNGKHDRVHVHPESNALVVKQGKASTLSRQFHDFMVKAGLVDKRPHRKKASANKKETRTASALTFHSFRHTLTSLLKNAGVSSSVAEEIVGHDSSEINRVYTHIDQKAMRKAMSGLPDVTPPNSSADPSCE